MFYCVWLLGLGGCGNVWVDEAVIVRLGCGLCLCIDTCEFGIYLDTNSLPR